MLRAPTSEEFFEMPDLFLTKGKILLQPGSDAVPYFFTFPAATSQEANDGSIPYGTTISSKAITAFDADGNDVTSEIIVSTSLSTPVVTVRFKYPATTGDGRYSIEFLLTLSTGAVMEFDFTRIFAVQ